MPERSKKTTVEEGPQTLARVEALEERMEELKLLAAKLKAAVDVYQAKRYGELCDALQALGPVAGDLVHELDETVGKRLCEAQDAILARAAEGTTQSAINERLWGTVEALEAEIGDLRRQLATEVRTQRLVVVDDDGFGRIEAEARGGSTGSADIKVLCREDPDTYVSLYVSDECVGSEAGLYLAGGDAIVGMLQVQQGGVLVNLDGEDGPHFEPGSVSHEAHLRFDSHHGTRRVRLDGDGLGVESRAPRRPADGGSHATAADPLSDGPLPHSQ